MCSDCEEYGLKHGITRSDCLHKDVRGLHRSKVYTGKTMEKTETPNLGDLHDNIMTKHFAAIIFDLLDWDIFRVHWQNKGKALLFRLLSLLHTILPPHISGTKCLNNKQAYFNVATFPQDAPRVSHILRCCWVTVKSPSKYTCTDHSLFVLHLSYHNLSVGPFHCLLRPQLQFSCVSSLIN